MHGGLVGQTGRWCTERTITYGTDRLECECGRSWVPGWSQYGKRPAYGWICEGPPTPDREVF